ncbi:MAG: patatin-like phospholipase family protein [Clostridium sp.]|nr:patatin-like phospholipase family protein [Clostridium sp.]
MKRLFIYILSMLVCTSIMADRKKVAVVMSGGGAKGMAHIGALKVIEHAGIPIDMVVGTSMGAVVGGLYAIGYTPEQLDSIVMTQDWIFLLSDRKPLKELTLRNREDNGKYILSVPFFNKPQDAIKGGVIRGRNIGQMLWRLTEGYHDSIDFRRLPLPFACVSQDVATGDEQVHMGGVLPLAIRSSMSIPGVFAPMATDGKLLVDGGIVNNYPVDVARRMGADIVIGIDVQDTLKNAADLQHDLLGQLSQLIDLQSKDRWQENIRNTDVYIKVNIKGYNTASFTLNAIDSLIDRGQLAAEQKLNELTVLKKKIGRMASPYHHPASPRNIPAPQTGNTDANNPAKKTLIGESPKNSINLGIRYDNEQLAALLFDSRFSIPKAPRHNFELTLRLGKQTYGQADYAFELGRKWNIQANYQLSYNDFNTYEKGERISEISFLRHLCTLGFTRNWYRMGLTVGSQYINYDYGSFLYQFNHSETRDIHNESYFRFGGKLSYNNLDHPAFATRGHWFSANYFYIQPTRRNAPFHVAAIDWGAALSTGSRFTILPRVAARYVTGRSSVAEMNTFGGQETGKYLEQQIPFYGINRFEVAHRTLIVAGIEFRQRMGRNHYISLPLNFGMTSDTWRHYFPRVFGNDETKGYYLWGVAARYDLKTFFGPIGLTVHYSNRTKSVDAYIRAGYNF